jgi:hypothetical protein
MAINDGDNGSGQNGQKGWGGLGAHAIVFGKSPKETALVSLGTASTGSDRLFLSAINPSIVTFSFRANDKGGSVVAANGIKLTIDGQLVTTTVAPKNGDATDVTYTRATPFTAGDHTYKIEVKDTQGNTVTDSGTFTASQVAVLTAAHQAVSVDKTKAGFIWRVVQNEVMKSTELDDVELALLGTLKDETGTVIDNLANENEPGNALAAGVKDGAEIVYVRKVLVAEGALIKCNWKPKSRSSARTRRASCTHRRAKSPAAPTPLAGICSSPWKILPRSRRLKV